MRSCMPITPIRHDSHARDQALRMQGTAYGVNWDRQAREEK
jgi:hypothetical protein